jgi:predicted amidohydrolase YtcJ
VRVLYRGGKIYTPAERSATALLSVGELVAWVGSDGDADGSCADHVVHLDGALLTPAFVDAHVHMTSTGLALDGLDLSGVPSLAMALDALAVQARRLGTGMPVLGTNWDCSQWPEGRAPTAAELDRAAQGAWVYLARVDGHSAVVSSSLARDAGATGLPGWVGAGLCQADAHHAVRVLAYGSLTPGRRAHAQRRAREEAARLGIGALHEMAGPEVSSADDLAALLTLARTEPGPQVVGYWAGDLPTALELGAGFGGDLFVDGSFGSRTAALCVPYSDEAGTSGMLYLGVSEVADSVVQATEAGVQAGFHAIGDAAVRVVLDGVSEAGRRIGADRVAAGRHRVEHCELLGAAEITRMARLGLVASVQPAFDARWGGEDGMYAERLGPARAQALNPFAALAAAGVVLALSSDAPVTPLDPWGGVRAAVRHSTPSSALSAQAAFAAATRGGWRATRADRDGHGTLVPGAPATLAVWASGSSRLPPASLAADLVAEVADADMDAPTPACLRTAVRGAVTHDTLRS